MHKLIITIQTFTKQFSKALFSLLLSIEIMFLVDVIFTLNDVHVKLSIYFMVLVAIASWLVWWKKATYKRIGWICIPLPALCILLWIIWQPFSNYAPYQDIDNGKASLYSDKRVMLIVPHQDDDLNVLGGVINQYIKYGSTIYIVFATNGDHVTPGAIRIKEAISLYQQLGIPEDQVIFLGYGCNWGDRHIYNSPSNEVLSSNGGTTTYSIEGHPAYHEGTPFTIANFKRDMEDVILQHKPDVIFASDYDNHIDHKAVSIIFENVMGHILQTQKSYRPLVFRGYAYRTCWEAHNDYYNENIHSTKYMPDPVEIYKWEDRLRLPIKADVLSHSLFASAFYREYGVYKSQGTLFRTDRFNADKVVWQRLTNSICYNAHITASSGNPTVLNDFMLLDNNRLNDTAYLPFDNVWIPHSEDSIKRVSIELNAPADLKYIHLYDNPSPSDNVLNTLISFEDGSSIETGALNIKGSSTIIAINKVGVKSFNIQILNSEGDKAGLSEIEAYAHTIESPYRFFKFMDLNEDFIYDYILPSDSKTTFQLYSTGTLPPLNTTNYTLTSSNKQCKACIENNKIIVDCPSGEGSQIMLKLKGTEISDCIIVKSLPFFKHLYLQTALHIEHLYDEVFVSDQHRKATTLSIWSWIINLF